MTEPIQSMWVGVHLSIMEQLSMRSFLAHGHDYHLYAYDAIDNVPPGVVVKDATEILPASAIFRYTESDSVAGFSNFFRYKLLLERGGWWVDTDLVCLKPFPLDPMIVSAQLNYAGTAEEPNCGAIKFPAGSQFAARAWAVCQSKDTKLLRWGETGPELTRRILTELNLLDCVKPAAAFCPVAFRDWRVLIEPGLNWHFAEATFGVHLWNELWRRDGVDKNARHPETCLYEQFKRRYSIAE